MRRFLPWCIQLVRRWTRCDQLIHQTNLKTSQPSIRGHLLVRLSEVLQVILAHHHKHKLYTATWNKLRIFWDSLGWAEQLIGHCIWPQVCNRLLYSDSYKSILLSCWHDNYEQWRSFFMDSFAEWYYVFFKNRNCRSCQAATVPAWQCKNAYTHTHTHTHTYFSIMTNMCN